jgi:signal transduction histidine kinase
VTRGLLFGVDALMVALVVVAVLVPDSAARTWITATAATALLAVYAWGRLTIRVYTLDVTAPRGQWWPAGAWVSVLLVLWIPMLLTSRGALWVAFPLMFVQMHFLGPRRGVLAVVVTTVGVAVSGLLGAGDWPAPVGFLLGPVIGAGVAVGVSLGLESVAALYQERDQALRELSSARDHLAAARLEAAVAAERSRLARDIHDTLAQGFSAVELLLRTAELRLPEDDIVRRHVSQARDTARQNLDEARRFVQALTPGDLEGVTLLGALQRLGDRVALASGVAVNVSMTGRSRPLPVPVETALVRVAQSALGNVVEHSGARSADVTLSFLQNGAGVPDTVVLDIVDDGCGFDPSSARRGPARGFGISGMRTRIEELGGSLAIESTEGEGTALAVRLPVTEAHDRGVTQVPGVELR